MVILWWLCSFFLGEKEKGKGKGKARFSNSQEEMLLKEHVSWISLGLNIRQHESWLRGSLREHSLSRSREPIAFFLKCSAVLLRSQQQMMGPISSFWVGSHIQAQGKLWQQSCKRTGCQLQATSLEYQNWSLDRNERHCQTAVSEIREQAWWCVRLQC